LFKCLIISAICAGWVGSGLAQEQPMTDPIEPEEFQDPLAPTMTPGRGALAPQRVKESTEEWGIQVAADYGYVGSASLKKGLGTVTEQSAEVAVVADRRVQDDLIFLIGGNTQMFSFGYNGANIPLPNNLLGLNMILGFDVALDEGNEWNMRIQIDPGVYGTTQSLGWHQVNVPGVVAFSNIVDEDFQWFIALRADIFNFFPVIPVPGFRWQFDKAWVLNGTAPKPAIQWRPVEDLDLTAYVGGDILNLNVRLAESDANTLGNRSLSGALLNYFEGRVGAGVEYQVTPNLALQLEGGATVWRTFDFVRINDNVNSTMAPYVQAALRGTF
jgi:hypothetical protein